MWVVLVLVGLVVLGRRTPTTLDVPATATTAPPQPDAASQAGGLLSNLVNATKGLWGDSGAGSNKTTDEGATVVDSKAADGAFGTDMVHVADDGSPYGSGGAGDQGPPSKSKTSSGLMGDLKPIDLDGEATAEDFEV